MKKLCVLVVLVAAAGCKDKNAKPADTSGAQANKTPEAASPALQPIGMSDPFARLSADGAKQLQAGYKLLRSKKYDDAATAFRAVLQSSPDYTQAGWQLVRALVLGGKFTDVPAAFEPLLAKDFVAYADRLDAGKEAAAFRNAPEYQKIAALKDRYRAAYAKDLDKGFFFVARTRAAEEPKVDGASNEAPLDLKQEVFHYELQSQRYRRLTETGGQAFAISRSPDGKKLVFVAVGKIYRSTGGGADQFVDPKLGVIALDTLETIGPFKAQGRWDQVSLAVNSGGDPVFSLFTADGTVESWTFDTAKTGLAKLTGDAAVPAGGETRAWPGQVLHVPGKNVEGVKISDGANSFTLDAGGTVTAARPLAQSSLDWSPSKARLTYAGKLDACKILKGGGNDKNELYVYDVAKKSAQRIAAAISTFETLWLDDDHLVYEGGVGKDGRLHVYAFVAHADTTLPTRHGAGLYGVPTLACEQAEPAGDEPATDEEEGD